MNKAVATTEPVSEHSSMMQIIERAARDPAVDIEKMERLLVMADKLRANRAEAEYADAMNKAQEEMRPVSQDASNPQTRSKYASYNALDNAMRPVYSRHGFSLSFDTAEGAPEGMIRAVCKVAHKAGHSERPHLDMPADGKGAKGGDVMTKTHATMAALTYARRGLLKMVFNIAEGEFDDDNGGEGAGDVITDEQKKRLHDLLSTEGELEGFLKFMGVASLDQIKAAKFQSAVDAINKRKAALAAKAKA